MGVVVADAAVAADGGPAGGAAEFVDAAIRSASGVEDRIVLVGHSGAGVFLPLIADGLGPSLHSLVFVDARLPPEHGEHGADERLRALLDAHADDEGRLPPWIDWWPDEVIDRILPDPGVRAALRADMPHLHRSFYDEPVTMPRRWSVAPCGYLKLSAAYEAEYQEAGKRRWPRAAIDGHHLSMVTDGDAVLDAIEAVVSDLEDA